MNTSSPDRATSDETGIRVKLKLKNPLDEYLVEQGQLDPLMVHTYETEALVNRQTLRSILPKDVVQRMDLRISRQELVKYANDGQKLISYSESVTLEIQGRETTVEPIVAGNEVVIGQVALELLDFVVDDENRTLVPNPAHPDYPVFRI